MITLTGLEKVEPQDHSVLDLLLIIPPKMEIEMVGVKYFVQLNIEDIG